ncbi:MAG: choice-of-anchor D domain-containing protein [Phycisphaerae bacterium]|nr:choice-of-anchor D domain-containing protein [Phycisphaerae bacterium]MCZ2401207.1 choice-of-anchor D domain-containing protein [Phycisphaerae bacterium]NUQ50545.1 choice-of-anchor D domain-containing protein [Phycisphaerae bacterium]
MNARNNNLNGTLRSILARGTAMMAVALASAAALAQPVLEVRIQDQVLTSPALFEFQAADLDQTIPQVVVLRNVGFADLVFDDPPVTLAGGFPEQFELVQPPLESGNKLSPNGSTAFLVRFKPTLPKESLFTTVFVHSNSAVSPFAIQVRGTVLVPKMVLKRDNLTVSPNSQVNVQNTRIGQVREVAFTIENQGPRPLLLTGDELVEVSGGLGSDQFYVIQQPEPLVEAFSATTFIVAFIPTRTGSAAAQVGISTNDVGNYAGGRLNFTVRSFGLPPDCNGNGIADATDIANGASEDCNGNGIPDECEPDSDGDGIIDDCDTDDVAADPNDAGDNLGVDYAADDQAEVDAGADDMVTGILPGPACGFGLPLASLMGLVSIGGARTCRRIARA